MRLFLTLCSLAVVAYAKPQYNYGAGISGTINFNSDNIVGSGLGIVGGGGGAGIIGSGAGIVGGGGFGGGVVSSGGLLQNGYNYNGNNNNGVGIVGSGNLQRTDDFSSSSGSQSSSNNLQNVRGNRNEDNNDFGAPIVHKQIFTFGAPEDKDTVKQAKRLLIGRPQTNYRVIFIKAPSSSSAKVKLSAEYAPKQEKTVIYVLTKKESELDVNEISTPAPTQPSKPEVHFIKYRTEQEADFAQTKITGEYNKIQGTSENIDGGLAKERSFIGVLSSDDADLNQVSTSTIGESPGNNESDIESSGSTTNTNKVYLPPSAGYARRIYKLRI